MTDQASRIALWRVAELRGVLGCCSRTHLGRVSLATSSKRGDGVQRFYVGYTFKVKCAGLIKMILKLLCIKGKSGD